MSSMFSLRIQTIFASWSFVQMGLKKCTPGSRKNTVNVSMNSKIYSL